MPLLSGGTVYALSTRRQHQPRANNAFQWWKHTGIRLDPLFISSVDDFSGPEALSLRTLRIFERIGRNGAAVENALWV